MKHCLFRVALASWGRLWAAALLLPLLLPAAYAQAPAVAITPAGPLTLCAGSSQVLTATTTLPGFNGGSGLDGYVSAVLVQPDGRIVVGGNFTSYNGNAAAPDRLLRLNADGSLDATFNAGGSGFDTNVTSVVVQPDGNVLLGGNFTSYNGNAAAPDRVVRLTAAGLLDTSFNPGGAGANNFVYTVVLQPDGKVLVGGFFTNYNGRAAAYLVRLSATGIPDASFNAGGGGPNDIVETLALQPDGKVLVGGDFTAYNNVAAPAKVLRLTATGSLDTTFNAGGSGASGFGFSYVFALAVQPDGKVLVGGLFANYNGSAAPDCVLRLSADGSLDAGFNSGGSGADNYVYALAVQPDGKVMVGGRLTSYNGNAAAPDDLLRLNADGSLNAAPSSATAVSYAWSNGATGASITVSEPGQYQVAATTTGGTGYSNVVAVNAPPPVTVQVSPPGPLTLPFGGSQTLIATATLPGFNVGGSGFDSSVNVVLVQPDGKLLVGGYFTSYNGNAAAPDNLLRLNADGSLDSSFNPGGDGVGGGVSTLVLQPDGKVLVGGFLRTYNGNAAAPDMLLRVNADGSLDTSFNPGGAGLDNGVRALAVQADGRILVGGGFASYNGNAAAPDNLLRLTSAGALDPSFNGGAATTNRNVFCLAVQPDGKLLVGGYFTGYGGSAAAPDYILRLNADGSLDSGFNPGGTGVGGGGALNTAVNTLAVQPDGKLLVGGFFTSYNGNAAAPDNLLRLSTDGSLDPSFNTGGAGPNESVFSLAVQPDGKALVGGYFAGYNGSLAAPDYVLRLNANGSLDTGFDAGGTGPSDYVNTVTVQPDGKVLAGGYFSAYNGNAAAPDNLVRLTTTGSLHNTAAALPGATFVFNPGASSGSTRSVSAAGSYTATATDPATGCSYVSAPVVVTVAAGDLTVSTGTPTSPISVTGTYNNVTVTGTGHAVLSGPLQANTTFQVLNGGSLDTNCQSLTGAGSFTLAAGATMSICDPAGITPTGISAGAVQLTGTRFYSPDASYIYNGTGAQVTGAGLPSRVRSLTTTNASTVTLSNATSVAQVLTVASAGNLVLGGQALTLLSSASGTALAVNSGTGVVTGAATVQRYITPANSSLGYRHYSAPVSGSTVADLAVPGSFAPIVNPDYNASATPRTVRPFPTVFGYDQSRLATTSNNLSAFDKGWYSPAALTDALLPGQGYTVNLDAGALVDFVGTLGTGDVPVSLARTAGATAADAGWALVGNPYPAPLDLSLIQATDRQHLDPAVYVFQSSGQYAGGYQAYTNGQSSGGTSNSLVPSGQGFFVRVSQGSTSGSLTFRNAQRVRDYATAQTTVFQRTLADARPALHLTLAGAGLADGWVAYAEPGATPAFEATYDATKLPNTHGLNLSSLSDTDQLAIDGRPAFTAATVLPLAVGVPAAGSYTLTASALDNLPAGLSAYLRDAATGQTLPLTLGQAYTFSVTSAQVTALLLGRFTVQFAPAAPLVTTPAALAAQVLVYPNPSRDVATVTVPGVVGARQLQAELFNALGQVVRCHTGTLPNAGATFTLTTAGLAPGVYTLRLTAGPASATKRLAIE